MKLTKYEHACFALEKDGRLLIVDPGGWTTDLGAPENVEAIVVTHDHPDHFDANALGALIAHNPDAVILADKSITDQLGDALPSQSVEAGESITRGPFSVDFLESTHAEIHPDVDLPVNLAVMINNSLYFPGDSFTLPGRPVKVLALPAAAPWMKTGEAADFASEVKADLVFPVHDKIASKEGKQLADQVLSGFVENYGGTYQRITDTIEIDG